MEELLKIVKSLVILSLTLAMEKPWCLERCRLYSQPGLLVQGVHIWAPSCPLIHTETLVLMVWFSLLLRNPTDSCGTMECFHHLEVLTVISHLHLGVVELACCFARSHWEVIRWDTALMVPQRCLCCSLGDLQDTCSCSALAQEHSVSPPCDTPGELQEGREQVAKLMKPTCWVYKKIPAIGESLFKPYCPFPSGILKPGCQ